MIKRVVVAGSRDYTNYNEAKKFIDICISRIKTKYTLVFVSGGCTGADMLGERYAQENGYESEVYAADWGKYGKAAGPIRNRQMAEVSDFVILFWDYKSIGTRSMLECALKLNKPIKIKKI